MRIVITGAAGLLGRHAHVRLHAAVCAARYRREPPPFEVVGLDRAAFSDDATLHAALAGADAVLHFAGVNRGTEAEVEAANPAIARRLVQACATVGARPHIVHANSTHAASDTPYGRSKRIAGEVLGDFASCYTDLVLAHVFGEGARPFYNNVTGTLVHQLLAGQEPEINPGGVVRLLHAGAAAQAAIDAARSGSCGRIEPETRTMSVPELYERLHGFHEGYRANVFPDLSDTFDRQLFNSYRAATYPDGWPRPLRLNADARGVLYEAVKGGGGGQTFLSTTRPGVTRGNHFHLEKVERFLVVKGEAVIRIRRVLYRDVWEFRVSSDSPAPVDMPTLCTHSIENVGSAELLTLFWTHDVFDAASPDTYADEVLQ